jgi:PTS system nitrogen regulatory IIA component
MMSQEMMSVDQLAVFLQRDARELRKLASRGYLPAHKVSGEYRFHPAEIHHWLETQMPNYTEEELSNLEQGAAVSAQIVEPLLTSMLSAAAIAVPLHANTKVSILNQLVKVAEQTWQVYDPPAVLQAIKSREEMSSTALCGGVAIPHPRRPLAAALGESLVAFGRTVNPIPFGAPHGGLTDLFFLICCRDDATHLQVLARVSRLLLRSEFLDELRNAESAAAAYQVIETAEADLLASSTHDGR